MSKQHQSSSEIQSVDELTSTLKSRNEDIYLIPGARRGLPTAFVANETAAATTSKTKVAAREVCFVTLSRHKEVLEYSKPDQVISLSLGMTVGEAATLTGENKQFLPISAKPETTLFEVLNTGEGGIWEHAFGGPRDLVMGVQAILASGETINTGGKVVKNVTGYDTTKILVGGRMCFAVPIAAHFRLFAKPQYVQTLEIRATTVLELLDQACIFMQSEIPISSLDICGSQANGATMWVQLAGHKVVVDELVKPLVALISKTHHIVESASEFDDNERKNQEIFELCKVGGNSVELSASVMQMRSLLSILNPVLLANTQLKLRPGTGRFAICCNDDLERNQIFENVRDGLENEQMSLVAAYADDRFERKVERIGFADEGSSNQAIIRSLKLRFDQKRILNPLVSW